MNLSEAGIGLKQPKNHSQGRGFSSPVRTEQPKDFPRMNLKGNLINSSNGLTAILKTLCEFLNADHGVTLKAHGKYWLDRGFLGERKRNAPMPGSLARGKA